jgi:hypothetical protein
LTVAIHAARVCGVKHRHAVSVAIVLALVFGLLMVGRARAAEPGGWQPRPGDTWEHRPASSIDTDVAAVTWDPSPARSAVTG